MLCVNAGSAAVEERRGSRLQHLHGDTSGKRGAGSLGPGDLSLPHTSASGRSTSSRADTLAKMKNAVRTHHKTSLSYVLRNRALAQKACWEPGCHLSSCASSRGSAPSWAGTRLERQRPSPPELTGTLLGFLSPSSWKTDQRACFVSAAGNKSVYTATLCVHWRGGVDKDAHSTVYSICPRTAAL